MMMRHSVFCFARYLVVGIFAALSLQAQIEPQLITKTDLLDVYKSDAGKPQLVTVMDFTTGSRAVFEPGKYLTQPTRTGWLGGTQSFGDPLGLGSSIIEGKDYGFIFILKNNTNEVYLQRWPNSNVIYGTAGVPYDFRNSFTGAIVNWDTDAATTIRKITHVRFTLPLAAGGTRQIDLPCPSQIFDSPYPFDSRDAFLLGASSNATKHAKGGTIIYDKWSDNHPILSDDDTTINTALATTVLTGYTAIGNFYYSYDYLSWIFGAKSVRKPDSTGVMAAPIDGTYASPNGYAVPSVTETTTYPAVVTYDSKTSAPSAITMGSGTAEGWKNGLPVMTRYQSEKVATINVFLNVGASSLIDWIYRFLDPYVDNSAASEEGGPAPSSIPANPDQSTLWNDATRVNRKFVRKLLETDLSTNETALQKMGPSGWVSRGITITTGKGSNAVTTTSYEAMDLYNFGNRANVDPRTPQPWAYALANTYYRSTVEKNSTIFSSLGTACPGKPYVLIFPTLGATDSQTKSITDIPQDAALNYDTYTEHGNQGLLKGSYTNLPSISSLTPGSETFHPGVLSCTAAFGDSRTNNGPWGAAWETKPATVRSDSNPGTQTMVISVGIPGSYKLKAGNNARNPEEAYFRVAQWSDPSRVTYGYGGWTPANGSADDLSKLDGGDVYYYYSTDPAALEKNFEEVVGSIVAGSAALSAPATPSTGARTTTQAYFGVFKTSTLPVWSGNLFSVGIKRVIDPVTKQEIFSFYGNQGESTVGCVTLLNPDGTPQLDPITNQPITQCGLNNFDAHHLWSAFDVFGTYLTSDLPAGTAVHTENVLGSPVLWSNRKVFTLTPGTTTKINFKPNRTNPSGDTLLNNLKSAFTAAGLFSATASDATKYGLINDFIEFYLGKHATDATKNRIGIFGDIINSAPLAMELSSDNLPSVISWPGTSVSVGGSTITTTDPHVRLILVGTNLGMLHCFGEQAYTNVSTNVVTAKATELWAFIPPDALTTMFQIFSARSDKTFRHRYLTDGDPSLFHQDLAPSGQILGDTRVSQGEDAVVVMGMRKGGRSYYALGMTSSTDSSITPDSPKILWKIDPQDSSSSATIQKMGMSTAPPVFAYVSLDGTIKKKLPVAFITGGYANAEVNAAYQAKGTIGATEGLGRSILAISVINAKDSDNNDIASSGSIIKSWDWSDSASIGAIPAGVAPVAIFRNSDLVQRIYFADMNGNVMAINANPDLTKTTLTASGFRVDSSKIADWTQQRFLLMDSTLRFTTRPDAFRLAGDYPVPIADTNGDGIPDVKPITVMVSIGSGDWNNPTDRPESGSTPATANKMYVLADRQDSANLGSRDTNGMSIATDLQEITDNTSPNISNWPSSYSDTSGKVTPGNANYLFKNKSGYYFSLLNGTLPDAVGGLTHDKILVSPLTKQGALFFSIFNINGNKGFGCSANSFTRTFRECDIMRPLALPTQILQNVTVGDTTALNRGEDSCTGLAFVFNSLASQLADAGDRVVQGGAVSAQQGSFLQQTGANTPDIKFVKDTDTKRGFKLRTWRIIR